MSGGGTTQSTDAQYVSVKTSVWWDIENCHVPKGCDPHTIAQNISSALVHMNYCGPVSVSAYGDTTRIPSSVQQALSSTGIALNHVPAGVKDASDKKILVDMLFWAVDNPAPANYLLISGDRDFSSALHQLRMRRYNILLAQPQKASAPLVAAAKSVWLWTSLVNGGPPLSNSESQQIGNNIPTSYSDTPQTPVSNAVNTKQNVDSYSDTLHMGNQKFPNNGRGFDARFQGKMNWRAVSQTNGSRPFSSQMGVQENHTNTNFQNPGNYCPNGPPSGSAPTQDNHSNTNLHHPGTYRPNVPLSGSAPIQENHSNINFHHPGTYRPNGPPSVSAPIQENHSNSNFHHSGTYRPNGPPSGSAPTQENHSNTNYHHLGTYRPNGPPSGSFPIQENHGNTDFHHPGAFHPNGPLTGSSPNFVRPANHGSLWSNNTNLQSNYQDCYSQPLRPNNFMPQPDFAPGNLFPPNSHSNATQPVQPRAGGPSFTSGAATSLPDIGNLNISGYASSVQDPHTLQQRNGDPKYNSTKKNTHPVKPNSEQNGHIPHKTTLTHGFTQAPEYPPTSVAATNATSIPGNGIWGTPGCPKPSEYVQGLIGVVLLALNTLKNEKIMPTEANISDCIRYGDPKHQNTDIKKALESAVEQQMVVTKNLGTVQFYVGKNERLWKCVNPIGGNPKQYSKSTWDNIHKFLTSPAGRSAIMASQCKYEAAMMIKNMSLKEFSLGQILQIINMVSTLKKWIVHNQSGWQPLNITVPANTNIDSGVVNQCINEAETGGGEGIASKEN